MMALFRLGFVCLLTIGLLPLSDAFPKHGKQTLVFDLTAANNSSIKWMAMTLRPNAVIDFSGICELVGDVTKPQVVSLQYHLVVTPCARLLDQAKPDVMLGTHFAPEYEVHGTEMVTLQLKCPMDDETFNEKAADEVWREDDIYSKHCTQPGLMPPNTAVPPAAVAEKPKSQDKDGPKSQDKDGPKSKDKDGPKSKDKDGPKSKPPAAVAEKPKSEDKGGPKSTAKVRRSVSLSVQEMLANMDKGRAVHSTLYRNRKEEWVCKTRTKNVYGLVFRALLQQPLGTTNVTVTINAEMRNEWGYLAALDHPFIAFYAVMTAIYSIYAFTWLIAMMCQYSDLLRVQFWIGAVIALGMIEKVFFFSQYNQINSSGSEGVALLMTAEFVSVAKRTLARLLVVVISLGFGIVKPRLGPNLVWVTAIGIVYFMAALVEGISRATATTEEFGSSSKGNVTALVVILLDVAIIYYVYASITDTMRTLRLRRNTAKLSLYRHFSNAIIFAVVASAAFATWSYIEFGPGLCVRDWQEMWLIDGFWHILFCFLLLAMMVLWRPSANNNRYAYSPLVDLAGGDGGEPEQMPSDAFEGMKLRNLGQEKKMAAAASVDDDLKWVEENIPTSLVDAAVPVLMDSEDELNISRFEVSKMQ